MWVVGDLRSHSLAGAESECVVSPVLTHNGRQALLRRCDELRSDLEMMSPLLREPERDERHVHDFERVLADLTRLEAQLASADTIDLSGDPDVVHVGMLVRIVTEDGEALQVRPVHPLEAPLDDERISWESPLGRELLGASIGDWVSVRSPRGTWRARVTGIEA